MRLAKILACIFVISVIISLAYISTQKPKVWCNRQWAGLALYKGRYRSWCVTFRDGRSCHLSYFHNDLIGLGEFSGNVVAVAPNRFRIEGEPLLIRSNLAQ